MNVSLSWYEIKKDGLPTKNQQVIAWARNGKDQIPNLMQECFYMSENFYYGYNNIAMRGVTHWMKFPEPPEEE